MYDIYGKIGKIGCIEEISSCNDVVANEFVLSACHLGFSSVVVLFVIRGGRGSVIRCGDNDLLMRKKSFIEE